MSKGKFIFKGKNEIEKALEILNNKKDNINLIVIEELTLGDEHEKQPTAVETKFHIELDTYFKPPEGE